MRIRCPLVSSFFNSQFPEPFDSKDVAQILPQSPDTPRQSAPSPQTPGNPNQPPASNNQKPATSPQQPNPTILHLSKIERHHKANQSAATTATLTQSQRLATMIQIVDVPRKATKSTKPPRRRDTSVSTEIIPLKLGFCQV